LGTHNREESRIEEIQLGDALIFADVDCASLVGYKRSDNIRLPRIIRTAIDIDKPQNFVYSG
jgi:hypothetical protein